MTDHADHEAASVPSIIEKLRADRLTRLRPITVREPDDGDAPSSGGVVLDFVTSPGNNSGTTVDLNRREAADLLDKLAAFLRDHPEP